MTQRHPTPTLAQSYPGPLGSPQMPVPLYRTLLIGVVPKARQYPPPPFETEDLQRAFLEITKAYSYSQFGLLPAEGGAQLSNGSDDVLLIQPGSFHLTTPITTTERTCEKAVDLFKVLANRFETQVFVQSGINVLAHVPVPDGGDPVAFLSQRLLGGGERASRLGPRFNEAGVKFRAASAESGDLQEEYLLVEPLIESEKDLWVSYNVVRVKEFGLDQISEWLRDAFSFVGGQAMEILEV